MEPTDVMACFERTGAILRNDHFVYTSWMHGSMYVDKKMLYTNAPTTALLCREMARRALDFGPFTCVVGPEKGGIILSQWVGYFLNEILTYRVISVFAEKTDLSVSAPARGAHFIFSDDYAGLVRGKDILLVDDVATRGGSLRNLACCVRECGGNIRGAAVLCNRGGVRARDMEIPNFISLMDICAQSVPADQCPLCARGIIPVNPHYGRGKEFIERHSTGEETPHHGREF